MQPTSSWRIRILIAAGLVLGGGIGWVGATSLGVPPVAADGSKLTAPAITASVPLTSNTIPDMVNKADGAVVEITATVQSQGQSPFGGPSVSQSLGSGFFISPTGELVTNDHVIQGATNVMVQIPGHGQLYPAQIVGHDYNMDLALLKVNVSFPVPYLSFADPSSILVGQYAIAIGNPDGLNQTVTLGIISAEGRPITIGNRQYVNLLQTDAAINPGNSGGPLLNIEGQVVGVDTAVQTGAQGVGFAIPSSQVTRAVPYLQQGQTVPQAWIGVSIQDLNPQTGSDPANLYGAQIVQLVPGGPAAQAGLKPGDVVTQFNGTAVMGSTDLLNAILSTKPGTNVTLTIWRNGAYQNVTVTLGTKPQNPQVN